jgi:hypothetical protein
MQDQEKTKVQIPNENVSRQLNRKERRTADSITRKAARKTRKGTKK